MYDRHETTRPQADTGCAREEKSPPSREESTVWVCVFESLGSAEVWICADEEIAFARLARVCRESWDLALRVDERRDADVERPPLPSSPPRDDREAVERYFAVMREVFRSYRVTPQRLITDREEG